MKIFYLSHTLYTEGENEESKRKELAANGSFFIPNDSEVQIEMHLWFGHTDPVKRAAEEQFLLSAAETSRPDIFLYQSTWHDVSDHFLQKIHQLNIKLVTVFADTLSIPPQSEMRLIQHSDYIIVYDSLTNYFRYRFLYESLRSPCLGGAIFAGGNQFPTEPYKKLDVPQIYDVSMIGSLEGIRGGMVEFLSRELAKHNINFHSKGGIINFNPNKPKDALSEAFLPQDKYIDAINKTKINIVSQTRPERSQIKCKVFEYMACGGFCLVDQNIEYELLLPRNSVVYYTSIEDCLKKIIYYYHHEEERKQIAQNGYEWFNANFNYKTFWKESFHAIHNGSTLPILPKVAEIAEQLRSKINYTDAMLAELKRLLFSSAQCDSNDASKSPVATTVSSSIQPIGNIKDPLSTGFWHSEAGWPQWIMFDYTTPQHFNVVHINNVLINNAIHLKDFSIEASNDLSHWTPLLTASMKNIEILQIFNFENSSAYRFYRITGYSNYHGTQNMLLSEVKFLTTCAVLPKISIIIPVFNQKEEINRTLESIREQHYEQFEVIIIDEGSIDGTVDALKHHASIITEIKHKKTKDTIEAYQLGLDTASGDLVLFLNAGDTLSKNSFHQIVAAYNRYPDTKIISCGAVIKQQTKNNNETTLHTYQSKHEIELSIANTVLGVALFNSRFYHSDLFKHKLLSLQQHTLHDAPFMQQEFLARLALNNEIQKADVPEILYHYHLSSSDTQNDVMTISYQDNSTLIKHLLSLKYLNWAQRKAIHHIRLVKLILTVYAASRKQKFNEVYQKFNSKLNLSQGSLGTLRQLNQFAMRKLKMAAKKRMGA